MIQLSNNIKPSEVVLNSLRSYQDEIDLLSSFEERRLKAKEMFSQKNKIGNSTFDEVKIKLIEMCSGARRCAYCEDSVGDEVEHFQPKDLYPAMCFNWSNYLYACGNCNGPKNNKFAIFRKDNGNFHVLTSPKGKPVVEPIDGDNVLINPRIEDPLKYCMLDLSSTFKFVVISEPGTFEYIKANYTFNEVLRLNEREFLREARKNAYINYKSRLGYYSSEKEKGTSPNLLDELIQNLKHEAHPTVWKEMQRYHRMDILKGIDEKLNDLFILSPEAMLW